jgi:Cyclic phosphodiesterase-like protein
MRCSLWLLPPQSVGIDLKVLIQELSMRDGASVPFEPHVTIVGGIDVFCGDDDHHPAQQLCRDLENVLRGKFGDGIDCRFQEKLVSMTRDDGTVQWNQALVAVLDQTPSLMALVDACRTFFQKPLQSKFAPMLRQPHLSLYYGADDISDLEHFTFRQPYIATELALWKTEPGTIDGVSEWSEVGRLHLL